MAAPHSRTHWKAWIRRYAPHYLAEPTITSVGIGFKVVGGQRTDEPCIQFTVVRKMDAPTLEALGAEIIPESLDLDGAPMPTDVIERGYRLAYEIVPEAFDDDRRRRVDPLVPGVSISHPDVSAGTLGAIVYDAHSGRPAVLSNWHVLHGATGAIGDAALQPGTHDDNRGVDTSFGTLMRSHLGVAGDAALASVDTRNVDARLLDVDVAPAEIADPDLGDTVLKSGRTTGVSHGVVTRVETMAKLPYGDGVGERTIGCFEIEADPAPTDGLQRLSDGGDSGAAWLLTEDGEPTSIMAGVHFAGSDSPSGETALACYASSIRDKLEFTLAPPAVVESAGRGFDTGFLGPEVELPGLDADLSDDAVAVDGSTVIDYTHFSLTQSKQRRLARFVAWNVDGGNLQRLSRDGISFRFDERFPESFQAGNDLYRANDLDRGHLARRSDLLWGPRDEAQRANEDSFHYPNIAPQMNDFNQSGRDGVWGELEAALFAQVDVTNLRISVVGGPVFRDNDRSYRGHLIPREYFKVIYYVHDGELRAQGFLLTQELADLEVLDFKELAAYQVPLVEIEERTGLRFTAPAGASGGAALEAVRVLRSTADLRW